MITQLPDFGNVLISSEMLNENDCVHVATFNSFRNWDTKVTLKPPGSNHRRQRSKSPPQGDSTGSSRSQSPEKN